MMSVKSKFLSRIINDLSNKTEYLKSRKMASGSVAPMPLNMIRACLQVLSEILYPTRCVFCHELLQDIKGDCCDECHDEIRFIKECYCEKCGKIRESQDTLCYDCSHKTHYFTSGRGMFVYEGLVKNSLFGLKFFNQTWVGERFGRLLAEYYIDQKLPNIDIVIPVPLHPFKQLSRGFNQAEIIATSFCKELSLECAGRILRRLKSTRPQKDLSDQLRIANMQRAFTVKVSKGNKIMNKRVLIIDDIYTTGATIDGCAKVLIDFGAKEVFFLAVAIGDGT